MSRNLRISLSPALLSSAMLALSLSTSAVFAHDRDRDGHDHGGDEDKVVLYFTRHGEKQTVHDEVSGNPGTYEDNCNASRSRCEEELSPLGELRAQLLARWFERKGIAPVITHVVSSDKQRTRQTVQPLADLIQNDYGVTLPEGTDGTDTLDDGVWQLPFSEYKANEINGNSGSVQPTVDFIKTQLQPGDVVVIAAHSGTIYRILGGDNTDGTGGLGIDTTQDSFLFPKKESDGKVPGFGDIWKVKIDSDGVAEMDSRTDVDFKQLEELD